MMRKIIQYNDINIINPCRYSCTTRQESEASNKISKEMKTVAKLMNFFPDLKYQRNSKFWLFLGLLIKQVSSFRIQLHFPPIPHKVYSNSNYSTTTRCLRPLSIFSTSSKLHIEEKVGCGSYGTVHLCSYLDDEYEKKLICKRPWNKEELNEMQSKTNEERCQHYFAVEKHCFEKLGSSPYVSPYIGTFQDEKGKHWMTFESLTTKDQNKLAPTLQQALEIDWKDQHSADSSHHHLYKVQQALCMKEDATFADTLDNIMFSLLKAVRTCHSSNIVHRDLKPSNLLCHDGKLVLIDFGSAADMDPVPGNIFLGSKKRIGLEDRVAVSPIFAAPEIFIDPYKSPLSFDIYSLALIFTQLLFNYLDERIAAGFAQQIRDVKYDMNCWLSRELNSKVRPAGLDNALNYLSQRPGMWNLLISMFQRDPEKRITSQDALEQFQCILRGTSADDSFFESIVTVNDICEVPFDLDNKVKTYPLQYIASFRRGVPLGLVLSEEAGFEEIQLNNDEKIAQWKKGTKNASPGDVFILDIVERGQADNLGIFEIGDKLLTIGGVSVAGRGFEYVLKMLKEQPKSLAFIKLQFDRVSARRSGIIISSLDEGADAAAVKILDIGAFSTIGKRKTNEDTFLLHDVKLADKRFLLGGVFDGHAGTAASKSASQMLPTLFFKELQKPTVQTSRHALQSAWQMTCDSYRKGCDAAGEQCIASYDEREGILLANTGSAENVAGTTASVFAISSEELVVLNCGDSRTLVISNSGQIEFATQDHTLEFEDERLRQGRARGLDYALPECSFSRWWITVGDMQYAIGRSLEGQYATSKGIISIPDITSLTIRPGFVLTATDGLWETMGNDEIARDIVTLRGKGVSATDAAEFICSKAISRGSRDNVSVVLVYNI